MVLVIVFFFKQRTAYEMLISDWSSDVCSSDLRCQHGHARQPAQLQSSCSCSSFQRCRAVVAMFDRKAHLVKRAQAIPVDVPLVALETTIGLVGVKLVDRVAGARAPEHLRVLGFQIGSASGREGVCQYV